MVGGETHSTLRLGKYEVILLIYNRSGLNKERKVRGSGTNNTPGSSA